MKKFLTLLSVLVVTLTGCVHERVIYRDRVPHPSEDIAMQEPPKVIHERILIAPGPSHLWIGGHWGWWGGAYAWAPGYWAPWPRYRHHWSPGVWLHFGGGGRWRHGHRH